MPFNFELKNTNILQSVKRERFPLFRFSKILANLCLFLFIIALLLLGSSFLNYASGYASAKMLAVFFSLFLVFWNISLFTELKIKKSDTAPNIIDAASNPDGYDLAGFLDFNSAKIVIDSIKFCKKRRIAINSTSLFYSAVKFSNNINLVCFRLGLSPKKLQSALKNYLEKAQKHSEENISFLDDFQKTIERALKVAVSRGHQCIGEKEILVALAYEDEFFKNTLVEFDLKPEDF